MCGVTYKIVISIGSLLTSECMESHIESYFNWFLLTSACVVTYKIAISIGSLLSRACVESHKTVI